MRQKNHSPPRFWEYSTRTLNFKKPKMTPQFEISKDFCLDAYESGMTKHLKDRHVNFINIYRKI